MRCRKFQGMAIVIGGLVGMLISGCAAQVPSSPAPTPVSRPAEAPKPTPVAKRVEKVKLQIAERSGSYINYYLPQAKGFYKDEDIDLSIIPIKATLALPTLMAGEVDYIGQVGGAFETGLMGAPVKVLASFRSRAIWHLYGAPGVNTVDDLKGKAVGVTSIGSSAQYATKMGLKQLGLDPDKDVTYVAIPDATALYSALKAKSLGLAALLMPFEMLAREEGLKEFIFTGDVLEIPLTGLATTEAKVKENPGQAKKVLKASLRGVLYVRDNPDEAVRFLMKEFNLDEKVARASYQDGLRAWSFDGMISPRGIEQALEQAKALGSLKKPVTKEDIDRVVDFTLLKEAQKELGVAR
ncbi:MAG: ABC transporter substrate-binding protein [Chloroflexi bacterium]|nr:ABC transporter substrate-binding protein [Chloroflexota bacterium]